MGASGPGEGAGVAGALGHRRHSLSVRTSRGRRETAANHLHTGVQRRLECRVADIITAVRWTRNYWHISPVNAWLLINVFLSSDHSMCLSVTSRPHLF